MPSPSGLVSFWNLTDDCMIFALLLIMLAIFAVFPARCAYAQGQTPDTRTLMLADFEDDDVLSKIDVKAVETLLTDRDAVTGKRALTFPPTLATPRVATSGGPGSPNVSSSSSWADE